MEMSYFNALLDVRIKRAELNLIVSYTIISAMERQAFRITNEKFTNCSVLNSTEGRLETKRNLFPESCDLHHKGYKNSVLMFYGLTLIRLCIAEACVFIAWLRNLCPRYILREYGLRSVHSERMTFGFAEKELSKKAGIWPSNYNYHKF